MKPMFMYRTPCSQLIDEGMSWEEIKDYRAKEKVHNKKLLEQFWMGVGLITLNIIVPTGAMFILIPMGGMLIKGAWFDDDVMIY